MSDVLDFDELTESPSGNQMNDTKAVSSTEQELSSDTDIHSVTKVMEKFSEEEFLAMVVKDKNDEETLFCDHGT